MRSDARRLFSRESPRFLTSAQNHEFLSSSKYRSRLIPDVRRRFLMMNPRTARYMGITSGRFTPRLCIDTVVPFLAIKTERVLFKHPDEALKVNRPDCRHALFNAHREAIHRHELRCAPRVAVPLITGFLEKEFPSRRSWQEILVRLSGCPSRRSSTLPKPARRRRRFPLP